MKQNKTDTNKQSFTKVLSGDHYINSLDSLLNSQKNDNINEIKTFVSSVCSKERKEEFNGSFDDYFNAMLEQNDPHKVEKIIHLIGKIGSKFPQLSESTVDALIHIIDDHMEPQVCCPAIREMGKIGHIRENTCNKIIDEINKVTHEVFDHDVTIDAIHALYEIGLAWKKKKKIFFPLLDILKRGDKEEKLEAIRAIRTQLEGYWEKPIQAFKELVLYDDDFEVRRVAAMSLGEVGAYTSFSVREAVFELTTNVAHQIQRLKVSLEKNNLNNFHIKCRLHDSKAILKILYHYIRIYKYGFIE
ncbi:MAG: HEAT repeat domain-containing protein [Candidatus Margulisbacteria bacterium]|nr:HEAT repeat domain-containing protein [Candidatus Margulisiibacteriota bacterium]